MEHDHDPAIEAARFVALGPDDDVRTFMALVLALTGAAQRIENATARHARDAPNDADLLVRLARAWDGMDGRHDVALLRGALLVLFDRAAALERA